MFANIKLFTNFCTLQQNQFKQPYKIYKGQTILLGDVKYD